MLGKLLIKYFFMRTVINQQMTGKQAEPESTKHLTKTKVEEWMKTNGNMQPLLLKYSSEHKSTPVINIYSTSSDTINKS